MLKQLRTSFERQKYLDELLIAEKNLFPYISRLNYVQRISPKNLHDGVYAFVDAEKSDYAKKKKSEVNIMPKVFSKLSEEEFKMVLYHENKHCRDFFEGIKVGGEYLDIFRLRYSVQDMILELRAEHARQDMIYWVFKNQREAFSKDVSLEFVIESEDMYITSYFVLKNLLMVGRLSDYERQAVEKHLLNFGSWLRDEYKHKVR